MKLLMLKGLPASGKSTFARKLAEDGYIRVNKDDLRSMLHAGKWSKENEKQILRLRDSIIVDSLVVGKSVVVDDTNLAAKHKERLQQIAREYKAQFETKFFDTSVEECIKRDLGRAVSVGEKVIRDMYKQFLAQQDVYCPPQDRPTAIICDIDGTLAHMNNRGPYDWGKVGTDTVDDSVMELLNRYGDTHIILLSGRDAVCRPETEEWLRRYGITYDHLFMRAENDNRKDNIVKRELFDNHIRDNYRVQFVLDDRNQVVEMWRSMGLKCLQVADGDF